MWRLEGERPAVPGKPPALTGSQLTGGAGSTAQLLSGRSCSGSQQMTSGFDGIECRDLWFFLSLYNVSPS